MDQQVWAASRDASVWSRPNTRSPKRVHIAMNVTDLGTTFWDPTNELWAEAACDPKRMPLDMAGRNPAEKIPESRRCRRPGCASRWPTNNSD